MSSHTSATSPSAPSTSPSRISATTPHTFVFSSSRPSISFPSRPRANWSSEQTRALIDVQKRRNTVNIWILKNSLIYLL